MKAWLFALIAGRRPQLVTVPFTANGVLVVPASVNAVDMSGFGARGTNASTGSPSINEIRTLYGTRRSTGVREIISESNSRKPFTEQASYCNPENITPSDPIYSSNQTCFTYDQFLPGSSTPATRGASATGVGKTFLGSLGNVVQTPTVFTNVAVTPGASYNIVVPTGGSVTISYYV